MNKVIITGRLGSDPELKTGSNGSEYIQFNVAVDRRYKPENKERVPDWFRCSAFGKTAVFISRYFGKGDGIEIQGRMENTPYEDKDTNKKRDSWTLVIEAVEFPKGIGKKPETGIPPADMVRADDIPF